MTQKSFSISQQQSFLFSPLATAEKCGAETKKDATAYYLRSAATLRRKERGEFRLFTPRKVRALTATPLSSKVIPPRPEVMFSSSDFLSFSPLKTCVPPLLFAGGGLGRADRGGVVGRRQDLLHPLRALRPVHAQGERAGDDCREQHIAATSTGHSMHFSLYLYFNVCKV